MLICVKYLRIELLNQDLVCVIDFCAEIEHQKYFGIWLFALEKE